MELPLQVEHGRSLPDAERSRKQDKRVTRPKLSRRRFLKYLLGAPLLPFFSFPVTGPLAGAEPGSGPRRAPSISECFREERLTYEIGFWLFKQAAIGRLSFRPAEKENQWMAVLEAETMGILGFVSRYRVDTYRAFMEEIEGGARLRALSFEEDVKVGNKTRKHIHHFDYPRRRWIRLKRRKDGSFERREEAIPPDKVYDDFITASYNFRYGVYGPIERGKTYRIPTFPRKGATDYEVRVLPKDETEKRRRSEKGRDRKDFLVKFHMSPEVTHSREGLIEGWLSGDLLPVEGTIKDVILFGDVRGTLIQNSRQTG